MLKEGFSAGVLTKWNCGLWLKFLCCFVSAADPEGKSWEGRWPGSGKARINSNPVGTSWNPCLYLIVCKPWLWVMQVTYRGSWFSVPQNNGHGCRSQRSLGPGLSWVLLQLSCRAQRWPLQLLPPQFHVNFYWHQPSYRNTEEYEKEHRYSEKSSFSLAELTQCKATRAPFEAISE